MLNLYRCHFPNPLHSCIPALAQDHPSIRSPLPSQTLQSELDQLKKRFAAIRQDNVYVRTHNQRLTAQLRKKDKQLQHVLSIKLSGLSERTSDATFNSKLQALKREMVSIARLTAKVRDLENEAAEKDEELKLLKSSMKFTLIKELQVSPPFPIVRTSNCNIIDPIEPSLLLLAAPPPPQKNL